MRLKQFLIILTVVLSFVVSYSFSVIAQVDEAPKYNFTYEPPAVITTLDSVTINVSWYDDGGGGGNLDTVFIYENSTGEWQRHDVYP